ncbi:MAG TPA: hemerythrin domain-containing protein [Kofleriaceae bacterium]|nr:hemerythrin domain-containing protein [Kofleriaceae bacterium]
MEATNRIVREHLGLRVRLDRLYALAAAPSDVLSRARWMALLATELRELTDVLTEHFAYEEQGGYLSIIGNKHPRLDRQIAALAAQHDQIREQLGATALDLGRGSTLEALRGSLAAVARAVDDHEHAESELIQSAMYDDIGPGD